MLELMQAAAAVLVGGVAGFRGIRTDCGRNAVYVIAAPRLRGVLDGRSQSNELLLHSAGVLVGALLMAVLTLLVGKAVPFPSGIVGALLLGIAALGSLALLAAGDLPVATGSPWRVPRNWAARGHSTYAGVFGLALGGGFFTALPSVGLIGLVLWALLSASTWAVVIGFVAFALGRILPLLVIAARARRTGIFPVGSVDTAASLARGAFGLELVGLLVLGLVVFA